MILKFFRAVLSGLVLFLGLATVSYIQRRFDNADLKKALQVVAIKRPQAQNCRAEITSRFRGTIKVTCDGETWLVDVVGATLQPVK